MLNSILFGNDYPIVKTENENNKMILYIKSNVKSCKCPKCGKESHTYHFTYQRRI